MERRKEGKKGKGKRARERERSTTHNTVHYLLFITSTLHKRNTKKRVDK